MYEQTQALGLGAPCSGCLDGSWQGHAIRLRHSVSSSPATSPRPSLDATVQRHSIAPVRVPAGGSGDSLESAKFRPSPHHLLAAATEMRMSVVGW